MRRERCRNPSGRGGNGRRVWNSKTWNLPFAREIGSFSFSPKSKWADPGAMKLYHIKETPSHQSCHKSHMWCNSSLFLMPVLILESLNTHRPSEPESHTGSQEVTLSWATQWISPCPSEVPSEEGFSLKILSRWARLSRDGGSSSTCKHTRDMEPWVALFFKQRGGTPLQGQLTGSSPPGLLTVYSGFLHKASAWRDDAGSDDPHSVAVSLITSTVFKAICLWRLTRNWIGRFLRHGPSPAACPCANPVSLRESISSRGNGEKAGICLTGFLGDSWAQPHSQ